MKKRLFSCVLVLLLVAASLSGCTGGKGSENGTSASNGSGDASSANAVVVGIQQDLDSLDPHAVEAAGTREVMFNIFEGLVKPDSTGDLVGAVASAYEISPDGKTFTFTLRENVTFHNGATVTAEDVKYSLDRAAGKLDGQSAPMVPDFDVIDSITIVDEKTVTVTLTQGNTEFIAYMTAAIIPKDYADVATKPIGTGPFKFVSYTPQQSLVVEKNEAYWGTPAYLDKVTFQIIADADSSILLALRAGTIDIYPYLTADQAAEVSGDHEVLTGTSNLVQALFLNNAKAPLNDIRVRQALCYAVNQQQIIDMVGGGYGSEIGSNFFPAFSKYYVADTKDVYNHNIDKAKQLLADAGYAEGFSLEISVPSNYQFHMDTAQVLVEQLKAVGVKATIKPVDWATWLSDVYVGRNYEATVVGLDADLAPSDLLKRYVSDASNNFVNYASDAFDQKFKQALASNSDEEKIKLYQELQRMLTADAASVYLQDAAKLVAIKKNLTGFAFYPLYVLDMSTVRYQ